MARRNDEQIVGKWKEKHYSKLQVLLVEQGVEPTRRGAVLLVKWNYVKDNFFLNFDSVSKGKKDTKYHWYWLEKRKKVVMKMRIITCFGNRTRSGTFLWLSWTRITDDFINIINDVASTRVFSCRGVLQYFLTMQVCSNLSLTYGFKLQVSGTD